MFKPFEYTTLHSTQKEAKRLLSQHSGPFYVWAAHQTAGVGRQGRQWHSQPGNLAVTYVVPATKPISILPLLLANCLYDVLEPHVPGQNLQVKWPNDILLNHKKVAGVLIDVVDDHVLIGIGANLSHHPENVSYPATSLRAEVSKTPDVNPFRETLTEALVVCLARWQASDIDHLSQIEIYNARLAFLDQEITFNWGDQKVSGTLLGVSEFGTLVLETDEGIKTFASGDITIG